MGLSEMNLPTENLYRPDVFSAMLYKIIQRINPGVERLELYEFRYGLDNLSPEQGWESVRLELGGDH